jgi:serpin B
MNALTTQLQSLADGEVQLSLANSVWGQRDVGFQPDFLDLLAAEYGSGMDLVDFRTDPEAARAAINEWVDQQTKQRISELLPVGSITTETTVALVNAIYLKAAWELPFIAELTGDSPFTTAAGDTVDVPTMRRTAQFAYATGDGWQAVELPYANSSLAMLIFLPEPDFLQLFEEIFLVTDATAYLQPQQVQLAMPRFDIESKFSLADQLAQLGMPLAFDIDDADFSGITTDLPLYLSAVVHQANITVGEEGTEAAAATAVVAVAGAAPTEVQPIAMTIDRPFVFALRDRSTDTMLFLGRVGDPRG